MSHDSPTRNWEPERYRNRIAAIDAVLSVDPGERLRILVPDSDGLGPDGSPLPASRFPDGPPANPIAGPIHVTGAEPGDALAVVIEDVEPDRDFGRTGIGDHQSVIPASMFLPEEPMPAEVRRWSVQAGRGVAEMEPPEGSAGPTWSIPLRLFPGLLATAPPGKESADTLGAGDHGGNLDLTWLTPGTTVLLPVHHAGGLLFAGDLHAAQGDGEFIGGAIEIGGWLTLHVDVRKGDSFIGPRFETDELLGATGAGPNMEEAMKQACARLVMWLSVRYGWDRWHTYHLVTQTAAMRPGNRNTAACAVPRSVLE